MTPKTEEVIKKANTIVVDKPVTKEDVEKLGKELDQLNNENPTKPIDTNPTTAN